MTHGVVGVVLREGRFLVIQRAAGILAGGAWCFPGGAIEAGESEQEALIRELREEIDADARPLRRVWRQEIPEKDLLLHWWLTELRDGALRANPAEVADIRWRTVDELAQTPELLESNRAFLEAVGRGLAAETG